ncbi:hypothetical protein [Treponema denticola]|nr:hypothetical protein [Treponema denticola]
MIKLEINGSCIEVLSQLNVLQEADKDSLTLYQALLDEVGKL